MLTSATPPCYNIADPACAGPAAASERAETSAFADSLGLFCHGPRTRLGLRRRSTRGLRIRRRNPRFVIQ
jgi:hypothetical protein